MAASYSQTQMTNHRDAALKLVLPYLTLHELVMLAGADYIRLVCTMAEVWSRRLYLDLSDRVRFRQLFRSRVSLARACMLSRPPVQGAHQAKS